MPVHAGEKMKIAVNDFVANGVNEALALSTAELLRTEIFKTGYLQVMERNQMTDILKEQKFQLSGATEEDMIEIGRLLSVQLMAMGSINRLGSQLVINIRLVDIEEGSVKAAETVTAGSEEHIHDAIRVLAKKISEATPLRGKVVGFEQGDVIISLGRRDHVRTGMTLRVQRLGKVYRDPATGESLGRAVIEVASLQVKKVMNASLSTATVIEEYADIKLDDIVAVWTESSKQQSSNRVIGTTDGASPATPVYSDSGDFSDMLDSGDPVQVRRAAKLIYRQQAFSPEVMQGVSSALENGYMENTNDKYHIDGMAWLCKVLAASGDQQYAELLQRVSQDSPNKKIRKHALKSSKLLGN